MHRTFMIAAIAATALISTSPLLAQGSGSGHGSMGKMGDHDQKTMGSHDKMMTDPAKTAGSSEGVSAVGVVNSVDESGRSVNLSHEPIAALSWPSMTMDMKVSESVDLSQVPVGSPVNVTLSRGDDGIYMVDDITAR